MLEYLVPFILVLGVLVFFHELGHYLVARWTGVKVEVFAIGFGPELFGWTRRNGERWKVCLLPLGGYVKMFGDMGAASTPGRENDGLTPEERAVAFHHKSVGRRAAVVAAGPAANFLLAIVLFAGLFMIVGRPSAEAVITVVGNSPAAEAGLETGDRIIRLNEQSIETFDDLRMVVEARPGMPTPVVVDRNGESVSGVVTPDAVEIARDGETVTIGRLGVTGGALVTLDPITAVAVAAEETWNLTMLTLNALGELITGQRGVEELGGPIRIAQLSGDVAQGGIAPLIHLAALLSINLGLINLFPIPVLDGGHLMFYAAEAIRGRPLGQRIQEFASMAGFAVVICLMVFATWNDLVQLQVFQWVGSLVG
ncbi:MAG: RIP metalloprotease RseP [Alphaproteobacteria bacterium]|nr:RIP metalloprotease RseP [Alphaproteobacteria bacterium]